MHSSQFFQLSHVLGVDRQTIATLGLSNRKFAQADPEHFILKDFDGDIDFGNDIDKVFVVDKDTKVLADKDGSPKIALHNFKKGRSVYLSGYKFTQANTRLLHRALFWAAGQEGDFGPWTCSNIYTDCAYYPKGKKLVVINSSDKQQKTKVFDSKGNTIDVSLEPYGIEIIDV
jgi:beta-D-galactosyl-(1->4)-L-rhamnose phosphorylase